MPEALELVFPNHFTANKVHEKHQVVHHQQTLTELFSLCTHNHTITYTFTVVNAQVHWEVVVQNCHGSKSIVFITHTCHVWKNSTEPPWLVGKSFATSVHQRYPTTVSWLLKLQLYNISYTWKTFGFCWRHITCNAHSAHILIKTRKNIGAYWNNEAYTAVAASRSMYIQKGKRLVHFTSFGMFMWKTKNIPSHTYLWWSSYSMGFSLHGRRFPWAAWKTLFKTLTKRASFTIAFYLPIYWPRSTVSSL